MGCCKTNVNKLSLGKDIPQRVDYAEMYGLLFFCNFLKKTLDKSQKICGEAT